MKERVLSVIDLNKTYKDKQVLKNVSFDLYKGEILGLVGRNGAGKTTIFRIIAGLAYQNSGTVELFGASDKEGLEKHRPYISATIEEPAFIPGFTAYKNLEYYRIQRGVVEKERVDEVLELVGLKDARDKKFKEFSLGMRQRLAIALALLHRPHIMIFDEPTNGLDPVAIREVRNLLTTLAHEQGISILVSSHILSELELLADRFIILEEGEIIAGFTKEEMQDSLRSNYVIQTQQPGEVAAVLEEVFNTTDYQVMPDKTVSLYDLSIKVSDLNKALVEHGVAVEGIYKQKNELEDLYISELEHRKDEEKNA